MLNLQLNPKILGKRSCTNKDLIWIHVKKKIPSVDVNVIFSNEMPTWLYKYNISHFHKTYSRMRKFLKTRGPFKKIFLKRSKMSFMSSVICHLNHLWWNCHNCKNQLCGHYNLQTRSTFLFVATKPPPMLPPLLSWHTLIGLDRKQFRWELFNMDVQEFQTWNLSNPAAHAAFHWMHWQHWYAKQTLCSHRLRL